MRVRKMIDYKCEKCGHIEINNKNRKKILKLLCNGNLKISDIQKELKVSYPTIWTHISILEKNKFVKLTKKEKEAGKPVYVSLIINESKGRKK